MRVVCAHPLDLRPRAEHGPRGAKSVRRPGVLPVRVWEDPGSALPRRPGTQGEVGARIAGARLLASAWCQVGGCARAGSDPAGLAPPRLSCRGSSPASSHPRAPAPAEGWTPATRAGVTRGFTIGAFGSIPARGVQLPPRLASPAKAITPPPPAWHPHLAWPWRPRGDPAARAGTCPCGWLSRPPGPPGCRRRPGRRRRRRLRGRGR